MVHHYIKTAIRNLLKSKLASLISIAGLAVALAGVFLVYAYVRWEMSYNHHFNGIENVYRVLRSTDSDAGRAYEVRTSGPLAPALVESYPEVEATVRLMRRKTYTGNGEEGEIARFCVADENVFTFFDLEPSGKDLLAEPGRVLISSSLAAKLYGGADPVGQLIQLEDQFRGDYEVAGTFSDFPRNTTVRFDVLTIRSSIGQNHYAWQDWTERGWMQIETFIRLRPDADVVSFASRIQDLLDLHLPNVAVHTKYHLQPFSRIYLHTLNDFGVAGLPAHDEVRYGDAERLKASVGVAVILLLVACANYVNLSTARASLRHREVGVRKAVGASRALQIRQFLSESLVVTLASVCAGMGIAYLALPAFRELVGSPVSLDALSLLDGAVLLLGSICMGVTAGAYPAFGLSSLAPVRAIRQQAEVTGRGGYLRRALVTMQFAASIVLIAFTFVVSSQVSHMQGQDPGFSSDQVISMMLFQTSNQTRYWGPGGRTLKKQYNSVRERFMSHPNVTGATCTRFGSPHFFQRRSEHSEEAGLTSFRWRFSVWKRVLSASLVYGSLRDGISRWPRWLSGMKGMHNLS